MIELIKLILDIINHFVQKNAHMNIIDYLQIKEFVIFVVKNLLDKMFMGIKDKDIHFVHKNVLQNILIVIKNLVIENQKLKNIL